MEGFTEIVERHWLVLQRHHEELMEALTKIGNELQFICEELEDKIPNDGSVTEEEYKLQRGISAPVDTNPSRE